MFSTELVLSEQQQLNMYNLSNAPAGKDQSKGNNPFFQPKLTVNQPNDIYEQEADATADRVMRRSSPASLQNNHFFKPALQRKCTHCEEEEKAQRKEGETVGKVNGSLQTENYLSNKQSAGSPMSKEQKSFFESRMGYDFSDVRIHTDEKANRSAGNINALAYTHGSDIVFGTGQYQPDTESGKHLLAHELTHVVQQSGAVTSPALLQRAPGDEEEAEDVEEEVEGEDMGAMEKTVEEVHDRAWEAQLKVSAPMAQHALRTSKRNDWQQRLDDILSALEGAEENMFVLSILNGKVADIEVEMETEFNAADALWVTAIDSYEKIREELEMSDDPASGLAAELLDKEFEQYGAVFNSIYDNDWSFDSEDVELFISVLDNKAYLKTARVKVEREMEAAKAAADKMSEAEVEEEESIAGMVWSVVGCDSLGECAADVALTALTGGVGKGAKVLVKGARAVKKVRKVKKVVKSAAHLGKTLVKGLKTGKNLAKFYKMVKGVLPDAFQTFAKWLAKDWKKVVRKISTDLIANIYTGDTTSAGTVSVARVNKEFIGHIVDKELGVNKPDPMLMTVALVNIVKGNDKPIFRYFVKSYVMESLKYRFVVNMIFENLRDVAGLTDDSTMKRIFIATIAEVAEDVVVTIPGIDSSEIKQYGVQVARKTIANIVGD